jgi:hypothetical protein
MTQRPSPICIEAKSLEEGGRTAGTEAGGVQNLRDSSILWTRPYRSSDAKSERDGDQEHEAEECRPSNVGDDPKRDVMAIGDRTWHAKGSASTQRCEQGPDQDGAKSQRGVVAREARDEPGKQQADHQHGKPRDCLTHRAHVGIRACVRTGAARTVRWAARIPGDGDIDHDARYDTDDRDQQWLCERP